MIPLAWLLLVWAASALAVLPLLIVAGRADALRAYGRKLTISPTGDRSGTRCS
jgi:hypothetical protein